MPKIEKVCECGKAFAVYLSQQGKQHCSQACSSRFLPRKLRTGEQVACEVCGTRFYRNPTVARLGRGRFCSRACHNAGQTQQPVVKACLSCGSEMRLKPSQAPRQYCSKSCEGLARIKRPSERVYNGRPVKRDHQGYLMVWEPAHPNKSMKGWQYEHRLVAERMLGRSVGSHEHVHHVNGVKDDNRPSNLSVMDGNDHAALSGQEYRELRDRERAELAEYRRRYGPLEPEAKTCHS